MAIPGPGPSISMTTLNTEFGGGFALSSYYRGGTYVPNTPANAAIPTSGTIALGNFYGSSSRVPVSLTATGNNYDVYTNRGPTYVAGFSDVVVTVPGTVGSASTGTYAMLVPSAFSPTDTVTIVNNGVIQGRGGAGGNGGNANNPGPSSTPGAVGNTGGNAIYVNRPTVITNNGTIAAGGGGGGGGGAAAYTPGKASNYSGGGGGGGGAGTNNGTGGTGGTALPGGPQPVGRGLPGIPGSPGPSSSGGAGGPPQSPSVGPNISISGGGGTGGGRGAAGSAGAAGSSTSPLGPNVVKTPGGAGGATGSYLVGNPFVTWPATGTRQGNVS